MSSVSECGGYLEVLQVSPETMLALQQTHRVQMQSDGTLIAMPLITSIASTQPGGGQDNTKDNPDQLEAGHKRLAL